MRSVKMTNRKSKISNYDFMKIISNARVTKKSSPLEVINFIHMGVTINDLFKFANAIECDIDLITRALNTTKRKLISNSGARLNKQLSENAVEIARLTTIAMEYFADLKEWNEWLDKVHTQFNDQTPRSFIGSIRGRELIEQTIYSLKSQAILTIHQL